jgi:hypothetical protein
MADCAYDPCFEKSVALAGRGWLPWAVIELGAQNYLGLYSCDHGHVWHCMYAEVAHPDDPGLTALLVSPVQAMPPVDDIDPSWRMPSGPLVHVIDWSPIRGHVRSGQRRRTSGE